MLLATMSVFRVLGARCFPVIITPTRDVETHHRHKDKNLKYQVITESLIAAPPRSLGRFKTPLIKVSTSPGREQGDAFSSRADWTSK